MTEGLTIDSDIEGTVLVEARQAEPVSAAAVTRTVCTTRLP